MNKLQEKKVWWQLFTLQYRREVAAARARLQHRAFRHVETQRRSSSCSADVPVVRWAQRAHGCSAILFAAAVAAAPSSSA
jgi:hypothetical protein